MDAARVLEIVDLLERSGVDVRVDGGWGIDALLGEQTREHDDLDVLVRIEQVERLEDLLGGAGYRRLHGAPPTSFELVDADGHQVDVHPIRFRASGDAVYRRESGDDWVFPRGSLEGSGSISGHPVRCLTPDFALVCHSTGYELDAEHRADVEALAARYALPSPLARGEADGPGL